MAAPTGEELKGILRTTLAPAIACIATNPADVAKTRLNMERELMPSTVANTSTLDCIRKTWRAEGLPGVQRGLRFSMLREASKGPFRMGLYEPILRRLHPEPSAPMPTRMVAAGCAGALSAAVCNPLDLLKTRVQLEAGHPSGGDASVGALGLGARMVREGGVAALWRGCPPNMLRTVLATCSIMPVQSRLKELWPPQLPMPTLRDAVCGVTAGAVATLVINPVDVVRVRIFSQPTDPHGNGLLYASPLDCAGRIAAREGPAAFYKGVAPAFLRNGPHLVLTFVVLGWIERHVF